MLSAFIETSSNLDIDNSSVKMMALKEAVALLVALFALSEQAKSKEATKYTVAHVEANSWSSAQTRVRNDPM